MDQITQAIGELLHAARLESEANYFRKSALTRLQLWDGQQSHKSQDKSQIAGSAAAAPTTPTAPTSKWHENSENGKKTWPTPPCNEKSKTSGNQGLTPYLQHLAQGLQRLASRSRQYNLPLTLKTPNSEKQP